MGRKDSRKTRRNSKKCGRHSLRFIRKLKKIMRRWFQGEKIGTVTKCVSSIGKRRTRSRAPHGVRVVKRRCALVSRKHHFQLIASQRCRSLVRVRLVTALVWRASV